MKRTEKYVYLLLLVLASCFTFSACSDDDDVIDPIEVEEEGTVEFAEGDSAIISAEQLCDEIFGPEGSNADEDKAELREQFMAKVHAIEDSLNTVKGANGITMGFQWWKYTYKSKDQYGKDIWLSAKVMWGKYWFFGWNDLDPNNIYLWEHYTILSDAECPTRDDSQLEMTCLGDNLVVMPDYIGYGNTRDKLHPYLNHEVCAINSIDAMVAGYEMFQKHKESGTSMEDDWRMYVLGCSQGASNALAVHKYLDTHAELASKWRFDYSYCCAGPYSPTLTMDYYYSTSSLTYPVIIPIVIKSMLDSYPDILGKWKEEDFYSEKYLKIKSDMDKLIADKETESKPLIQKMKDLMGLEKISVNDLLSKDALDKSSEMTKALYKCLEKNDLTTGWTPSHLIKLYHGPNDDIVPYTNAQAVVNAFGEDKVSLFNSYWVGHVTTCEKWYGTLMTNNW